MAIIQGIQVEDGLQEILKTALKEIEGVIGYKIELNTEKSTISLKLDSYSNERVAGQYSSRRGVITLSDSLYHKANDIKNQNRKECYSDLIRTLVHEIGHRIHDIHFGYKTVRLPREGRTFYSTKNCGENFAEAFENMIIDKNEDRFKKRSKALKRVLDKKFIGEPEKPAVAKTKPQLRKELLTLTELCETRVHMTTKAARVKLRKSGKFTKGPAGWAWDTETQAEEIEKVARFLLGEDK